MGQNRLLKNNLLLKAKRFSSVLTMTLCLSLFSMAAFAKRLVIEIEIKNHFFVPDKIEIPAKTKVKLIIHNRDMSSEEFESYELNREKIIMGGRKANIFIGPLAPGEYPFFGEFNQKTAQGIVIVK